MSRAHALEDVGDVLACFCTFLEEFDPMRICECLELVILDHPLGGVDFVCEQDQLRVRRLLPDELDPLGDGLERSPRSHIGNNKRTTHIARVIPNKRAVHLLSRSVPELEDKFLPFDHQLNRDKLRPNRRNMARKKVPVRHPVGNRSLPNAGVPNHDNLEPNFRHLSERGMSVM